MNGKKALILLIPIFWTQQGFCDPVTSLYVSGEPNEWVTRGETVFYTDSDFDLTNCEFQCYDYWWPYDGVVDRLEMYLRFTTNRLDPGGDGAPNPDRWTMFVGTDKIPANLTAGLYPDAQRTGFAEAGHPGIDVSADHHGNAGCDGSFRILHVDIDYSGDAPILRSLAMTFRQSEAYASGLRRWLHGTFLYNYSGALLSPSVSSIAIEARDVELGIDALMPGTTVTVECATDLAANWESQTSFVCRTMSYSYTNSLSPTNTVKAAFYRITVE